MNEMVLVVATSVGWVGAVGTVTAYALVSRSRLDAHSLKFQAINVVGAGLLALSAMSAGNWPSTMSNLVWMSIGAHALLRTRHAVAEAFGRRWQALRVQRESRRTGPDPESRTSDEVILAA